MDRMGYERGLISYTTEHKLEGKKTAVMRPKLVGYGVVMTIVTAMFIYLAMSVMPMELDVIRDRNQLYRVNNQGLIENTYTLKILNKTQSDETYTLSVKGLKDVQWYGPQTVKVQAGEVFSLPISLGVDTYEMTQRIADITFVMERASGDKQKEVQAESRFITDL
jgi:polyferredoxin